MNNIYKKLGYIVFIIVIGLSFFTACNNLIVKNSQVTQTARNEIYEKAKVLEVFEKKDSDSQENYLKAKKVKLRMLTGEYKGQEFITEHTFSGTPGVDFEVNKGDKVIIYINKKDGELIDLHIADLERSDGLTILLILFVALLILIGGWKGLKALVALGFTIFSIFKILIPAIVNGYSPLPITIFVAAIVTILTMLIIAGFTKKSLSAMLGAIIGVVIAGLLALLFGNMCHLRGISSEECRMILLAPYLEVDLKGLLFSGIIIGALGAIMDVTMSIASTIDEIYRANPDISWKNLIKGGMNVGKDIMGTMTNTLILAYTGGSLPLLFLYTTYDISAVKIFNLELISTEIIRALVGSIGLVLSVPVTAFIASTLINLNKNKIRKV